MDIHATEEEQIQAIKKWFKENGSQWIMIIGISLLAVSGWQFWQKSQLEKAESASIIYQDMIEAAQIAYTSDSAAEEISTAKHLAQQLQDEYSGSQYAHYANLMLAKFAVLDNDLDSAEKYLNQILDQGPDEPMKFTAQLRLARVIAAKGDAEKGLDLVRAEVPKSWLSAYEEVRGDLYLQMGDKEKAYAAYQRSVKADEAAEGRQPNQIVQMKLDDLAMAQ